MSRDLAQLAADLTRHIRRQIAADNYLNKQFSDFLHGLQKETESKISTEQALEFLVQYHLSEPIFKLVFRQNPYEAAHHFTRALKAMQRELLLNEFTKKDKRAQRWQNEIALYAKNLRLEPIEPGGSASSADSEENLAIELYQFFYKKTFPKLAEKLGIVYTPIEVVDFIIASLNDLLAKYFQIDFNHNQLKILDPFTGTGIFITRLLASNLIAPAKLGDLYYNRLFANEIVPLAYYLADLNIANQLERRLTDLLQANSQAKELKCPGIRLSDSFELYEKLYENIFTGPGLKIPNKPSINTSINKSNFLPKNGEIMLIFGNPPYCKGQRSANDDNSKAYYKSLDNRIAQTYIKGAQGVNSCIYDHYIRAFRSASDWLGDNGIIAFIAGSALLEKNTMQGLRKDLAKEFCALYFLNLRGDVRKNMFTHGQAGEGGNIFGASSQNGIAIAFLVKRKKPHNGGKSAIYYYDIGSNLSTSAKKQKLSALKSLKHIAWQIIEPNAHYEWLNQRSLSQEEAFAKLLPLSIKEKTAAQAQVANKSMSAALFNLYSRGLNSAKDAWIYNFSPQALLQNMQKLQQFYNKELERKLRDPANFQFNYDREKIAWSADLKAFFKKQIKAPKISNKHIFIAHYRPFCLSLIYYDWFFSNGSLKLAQIFPRDMPMENRVITITGIGMRSSFAAFMTKYIANLDLVEKTLCYPLFYFEKGPKALKRHYAISEKAQEIFARHLKIPIDKNAIFYYSYAILNHPDYLQAFNTLLTKQTPRIPLPKDKNQFQKLSQLGYDLGELHANFLDLACYNQIKLIYQGREITLQDLKTLPLARLRVSKMRFARPKDLSSEGQVKNTIGYKDKKAKAWDKSIIHYNEYITIANIPLRCYDYRIADLSAIEWVMLRQRVKTDTASQISKDPNDFGYEVFDEPAYPLKLLLKIITLSLQSLNYIARLKAIKLDIS